jgi:hypothetical protein
MSVLSSSRCAIQKTHLHINIRNAQKLPVKLEPICKQNDREEIPKTSYTFSTTGKKKETQEDVGIDETNLIF